MANCVVELSAQTASFRDPEFQNYHRTLALPPPTTIIGIVGAVLGYSPEMAQNFIDRYVIKAGVWGKSVGKAKDLWKYNNRKDMMWLHHPNFDGSVIHRDFLVNNSLLLGFQSAQDEAIKMLSDAFLSPVFAVSLGNSDSLAKINRVVKDIPEVKAREIEYCMVEGDIIGDVLQRAKSFGNFSIYQTSDPIVHRFPLRFDYQGDYGKRKVRNVGTFSIIGRPMTLNYEIEGLQFFDRFIPIVEI